MLGSRESPDELVELTTAPNEAQAAILQSVLADAGIGSCTQKAPGFDYLGLGTVGFSITSITVRRSDLESARAALDANRQDSIDLDWTEVDVGEPEDPTSARISRRGDGPRQTRSVSGWWAVVIYIVPPALVILATYILLSAR